jgi:acyloxyacyl hydrolase
LGVAVIGDSAGAHFSIPEKYFNATMIQKGTYNDLLSRVANELDIPYESTYTANTVTEGYTRHSIYKYLHEWNLCNHNDYQNVAVNGGDSGNTWGNIKALKRNQQNDHPLLMFMELIGNDVCKKSFNSMTDNSKFKENILKLLNYLDATVPKGSHLMILGLGAGDVLYDNLHDSVHPLNVTYTQVYDFLNCLKISPCWGWLNSNQTVREFTSERARNLSKVYQEIIDDGTTFENFDLVYYDFPTMEILERKIMEGGDPKELI